MLIPKNSAAQLQSKLESENELWLVKIEDAKRSYGEYIYNSQKEIEKNIETIESLKLVSEWSEVEDLLVDGSNNNS